MRALLVFLLALVLTGGVAWAQGPFNPPGLAWDPNAESDLAGYNIYESLTAGGYTVGVFSISIPVGTEEYMFSGHADGHFFSVITAYDQAGNESGFSNEVEYTFDTQGCAAPQNYRVLE